MRESAVAAGQAATGAAARGLARVAGLDARNTVLMENPWVIRRLTHGGGFGGTFSAEIAQNMFGRTPRAIQAARELTEIVEVAPRTWLIRLPIVNAVLFETDAGLVLVDAGMGPAGPALLEAIRKVSDAPLHTLIYTHGHVDHVAGAWALVEDGVGPKHVIAHEKVPDRFRRYIRLRGSLARYMSQPLEQFPSSERDYVWPTQTFQQSLELVIGGEHFILRHHPSETDDQLIVWVPARGALASADMYQGFLPNVGNGKRVQRYVEEWSGALREMAALEPALLLPGHGPALTDAATIENNLVLLADALDHLWNHAIDGLNAGLRKDEIVDSLPWPQRFSEASSLSVQYVSPQDIVKMILKRHTGWWDDIPSNWTPAPRVEQARTLIAVAGGIDSFVGHARILLDTDLRLACHLADWAFEAEPSHAAVQQLVLDAYRSRIRDPTTNVQEILVYIDQMAAVRALQMRAGGD